MMRLNKLLHVNKKPQCSGQKNRWYLLMLVMPLLLPMLLLAQTKTVIGTIKDEKGNILPGVSILVKGTKTGIKTSGTGQFSLAVAPGAVLILSFTGYEEQELKTTQQLSYAVVLKEKTGELGDVVVNIGYGAVRRKDATIALGTVNVKDLQKAPVRSFDEALAGRVAGLQVTSTDGQPGSAINILIRGAGSINGDASPLYVVDGFPMYSANFNTNQLDPSNIESIEVLKDAAATAIYGSSGANGVVLITTKRGKTAPPSISLNAWYGSSKNIKQMKMLNTADWFKLQVDNALTSAAYTNPALYPPDYTQYVYPGTPPHGYNYLWTAHCPCLCRT